MNTYIMECNVVLLLFLLKFILKCLMYLIFSRQLFHNFFTYSRRLRIITEEASQEKEQIEAEQRRQSKKFNDGLIVI